MEKAIRSEWTIRDAAEKKNAFIGEVQCLRKSKVGRKLFNTKLKTNVPGLYLHGVRAGAKGGQRGV